MSAPPGTAPQRTGLAVDRTVVLAGAVSVLLLREGLALAEPLDVLAGAGIAVAAGLCAARRWWTGASRLALLSALVAASGLLVAVQILI